MRVCLQRVSRARVTVDDTVVGTIGAGYLLLLGISATDTAAEIDLLVNKILNLRILEDANGVMNLSAIDVGADQIEMLVVSQFTLYADVRKGRRPSWVHAAPPESAAPMVEQFVAALSRNGFRVATGQFGAHMAVELVNDGPVTIWLDTEELRTPRRGTA